MRTQVTRLLTLLTVVSLITACDRLGLPDPAKDAALKEEESKAIGGACRHSGRALEDCYTLNPSANKAAVFAGWREMNDYMTQNKIEAIKPEYPSMIVPRKTAKEEEPAKEAASEPEVEESASARRKARRAMLMQPPAAEKH